MTEAVACKYIQDIINNQQKDVSQRVHAIGFRKKRWLDSEIQKCATA